METFAFPPSCNVPSAPRRHTTRPIVTGTSVVGCKYKGGVMIASDTLGSYGSMARFRDLTRVHKVGKRSILGAGGEFSDFQKLRDMLDEQVRFGGRAVSGWGG